MNSDERLAKVFLDSLGFRTVDFEPDGNIPPDFLLDGRIAVEVRRLNQTVLIGGKRLGLESDNIALSRAIRQVLKELGPAPAGQPQYCVEYKFSRPLASLKRIKQEMRQFLSSVRRGTAKALEVDLACGVALSVVARPHKATEQFRPMIVVDEDSGGLVVELVRDSLQHAIVEKAKKVAPYRAKYPEWWLVLLDHIAYALDSDERTQLAAEPIPHDWNRIYVVSPLDPTGACPLW